MTLLMCRSCGEFVRATPEEDGYAPIRDRCPACDGADFVDAGE